MLLVLDDLPYLFTEERDDPGGHTGSHLKSIDVLSYGTAISDIVEPRPITEHVDLVVECRLRELEHEILYMTDEATGNIVLEIGTEYRLPTRRDFDATKVTFDFVFEWNPAGYVPSWFNVIDPDPPVEIRKKSRVTERKAGIKRGR